MAWHAQNDYETQRCNAQSGRLSVCATYCWCKCLSLSSGPWSTGPEASGTGLPATGSAVKLPEGIARHLAKALGGGSALVKVTVPSPALGKVRGDHFPQGCLKHYELSKIYGSSAAECTPRIQRESLHKPCHRGFQCRKELGEPLKNASQEHLGLKKQVRAHTQYATVP